MRDLESLRKELKNKERTIDHLIRYCSTRTDNNPNYSLLLGAGCSVTSGIEPATKLIKKWKEELYLEEITISEEDYDPNTADAFFKEKLWYDPRNPYSALFEKRYDLPRQRRMFVEQEVRDAKPSIGYSYLIKLVESNFFKTIFTTNFDDLINEAFYQFSNERPLVCAHDSAISSITITSKRPKIIKLHGDYLFDDIKSTLRETESLEDNIKNKFSEFAKDYGLIVIGYGGNDRSIVDILNYLLKNEEYFKHGIYWCLRKGSYINEDLRKLLWKERVYYVEIDGYDELLAEMHDKLNGGELPIDSSYLDQKKDDIIDNIVSNKMLKGTDNKYIIQDFEKLKSTRNKDIVKKFFDFMDITEGIENGSTEKFIEKSKLQNFNTDQREKLAEINNEFFIKNYVFGESVIRSQLSDIIEKDQYYLKLLRIQAQFLKKLGKIEDAKEVYKEVLKYDASNVKILIHLSKLYEDFESKVQYLNKAISVDPYDSSLRSQLIEIKLIEFNNTLNKSEFQFDLNEIEKEINDSLLVDPSINNNSWFLYFRLLSLKKINKDDFVIESEKIISKLEQQDPLFPNLVEQKVKLLNLEKKPKEEIYLYIQNSINKSISSIQKKYLEFLLLDEYSNKNDNRLLQDQFINIENKYSVDDDYLLKKAELTFKKLKNLNESINIMESLSKKGDKANHLLFHLYLFNNQIDKAEEVIKEIQGDKFDYQIQILNKKENYKESIDLISQKLVSFPNNRDFIISKSYCLLKNKDFRVAYSFCNEKLQNSNFSDRYLLVNYYIAADNIKKPIKKSKIEAKILDDKNNSDQIILAGHALLDNVQECARLLNKLIETDYANKFIISEWPVLEKVLKNQKIRQILN